MPPSSSGLSLTGSVTTLAGTAGMTGTTDATGAAARFDTPRGITTDGTKLYVADTLNHTIRQIVISTGVVTTLAGTAGMNGSTDATGAAARFNQPRGVSTDGTNLYVADSGNHTIRQIIISTGVVTTLAGSAGMTGTIDATGAAARFNQPRGVSTDGTNLYVVDIINHTIRQIVIATGVVTTLAGSAGMSGSTDATGTAARFTFPNGLTTDGASIYVADSGNSTIRQIVIATGVVTTLAGSAGMTGSTDGNGAVARFSTPEGIINDGSNLYIVDSENSTIRQIVIATGVVTTLAGSAGMTGSTDDTGAAARFSVPNGITTDDSSLFLTDTSNHIIRQID